MTLPRLCQYPPKVSTPKSVNYVKDLHGDVERHEVINHDGREDRFDENPPARRGHEHANPRSELGSNLVFERLEVDSL